MAAQPNDWQDVDDWQDVPDTPAKPPTPNRAMMDAQSMADRQNKAYQDATAQWQGEANARGAMLETAARGVPGLVPAATRGAAGITGSVAKLLGADVDPEDWRNAAGKFGSKLVLGTDQPSESTQRTLAPLAEGVSSFLDEHPALHAGATAISDVLGVLPIAAGARALAPGVGRMVDGLPFKAPSDPALLPAYTRTPVADLANRGYTVAPRDVQARAGVERSGDVTGGIASQMGPDVASTRVPVRNARNATLRASEDIPGIRRTEPGAVDPASVAEALDAQAVPYEQIARDLPAPAANTLAPRLRAAWEARGGSLKGDPVAESRLAPLMDENAASLSSADLLQRWREVNGYVADLRRTVGEGSAGAAIKSGDLRAVSNALLDELDARAQSIGRGDAVPALQEARTNIARIHALDDSLDPGGFVQGEKLAQAADQQVPLSGGLAEVAADARQAPHSFRNIETAVDAQGHMLDRFGMHPRSFVRNIIGHLGGNALAEKRIGLLNNELRAGSSAIDYPAPQGRPPAPLLSPRAPPQGDIFGGGLDTPPTGLAPAAGEVGAPPTPTIGGRPTGSFQELLGELSQEPNAMQFPGFNEGFEGPGIPARPRGVSGPRSAQLSDPQLPEGLQMSDVLGNNASGQTAASLEALSALEQQSPRFRINVETGERTPLPGLEARDPRAYPGEVIVEEGPEGLQVVDRGGVPQAQLAGILARAQRAAEIRRLLGQ